MVSGQGTGSGDRSQEPGKEDFRFQIRNTLGPSGGRSAGHTAWSSPLEQEETEAVASVVSVLSVGSAQVGSWWIHRETLSVTSKRMIRLWDAEKTEKPEQSLSVDSVSSCSFRRAAR